jgi:ornithine--oxo-acid transaminase
MAAGLATLAELDDRQLVTRSAELGVKLLERTRPLVERYGVVSDVRGLGLMWAIEFGEPVRGRRSWRAVERAQQGLFAQFVVIPLFTQHRVLSQVAGHGLNVIKAIPPLVLSDQDVDDFVDALDAVLADAERIPRAAARFALKVAVSSVR